MSNKQNDIYEEANEVNLKVVDGLIEDIKAMMVKQGIRQLTNSEMRQQADNRRSIASAVKLTGGEVKEDYK